MAVSEHDSPRLEARTRDGVGLLALVVPRAASEVELCPAAGFSAVSFKVGGGEYLHLPSPLAPFVAADRTGGIPLLHPFANRLRGTRWSFEGRTVDPDATTFRHADGRGLPMHGYLLRWPGTKRASAWQIRSSADSGSAVVEASIDWGSQGDLMSAFPFPHRLTQRYRLDGRTLEVETSVEPRDRAMPVSFGWHPYFHVPGATRAALSLSLPRLAHVALDEGGLPVRHGGRLQETDRLPRRAALAEETFDDLFRLGEPTGSVTLAAGDASVVIEPRTGIRFLQVYSPAGQDFAAIEPMTAPTAALDDGGPDLPVVEAGEVFSAGFRVTVRRGPVAVGSS
jgi:aldose 1-epimerase